VDGGRGMLRAGLGVAIALICVAPAIASNLVTGNGYGFGVVDPARAVVTRFYTHPYSFMRPDPANALGEGVPTPELIKSLRWGATDGGAATAEYENDSQIIHLRGGAGEGFVYMPFSLRMPALIVEWTPGARADAGRGWQVEWNHRVLSRRLLTRVGVVELRFEGVDESVLLIPIGQRGSCAAKAEQPLCGNHAWALVVVERTEELGAAVRAFRAWRGNDGAAELRQREMRELESWRAPSSAFCE